VLKRIRLPSLAYGVVYMENRLTYFTNYMLTSRHECKFNTCCLDLDKPRRLANCKANICFCDENPPIDLFPAGVLFCTKRSHNHNQNRFLKKGDG